MYPCKECPYCERLPRKIRKRSPAAEVMRAKAIAREAATNHTLDGEIYVASKIADSIAALKTKP
jgi:glutaredoxin